MKEGVSENNKERAIVASVILKHEDKELAMDSLDELIQLADSAGLEVVDTVVQFRDRFDGRTVFGKGKLLEIHESAQQHGADLILINQELNAMQVRNIEKVIDLKIIDRTQLILDIFATRARTSEGKLQVELAQLNYLLPRLAGVGKHLSRLGGGIGTRGPGETQLETDRRHIRRRIKELEMKLQAVVRHRQLHQERRGREGVVQVALVGYTNAGKSTILKQLSGADVLAEDRLFSTLDPLSKRVTLPSGKDVIISDTVGFIRDIPHDLIQAFRATLEEVLSSDLILIVVDGSSKQHAEQLEVVHRVLNDLGAYEQPRITVFNKLDLCTPEQAQLLISDGDYIRMSAFDADSLERLKQIIQDKLFREQLTFVIPVADGRTRAMIYRIGDVIEEWTDEEETVYKVQVDPIQYERKRSDLERYIQYNERART